MKKIVPTGNTGRDEKNPHVPSEPANSETKTVTGRSILY
jgi:hypothetical protein